MSKSKTNNSSKKKTTSTKVLTAKFIKTSKIQTISTTEHSNIENAMVSSPQITPTTHQFSKASKVNHKCLMLENLISLASITKNDKNQS